MRRRRTNRQTSEMPGRRQPSRARPQHWNAQEQPAVTTTRNRLRRRARMLLKDHGNASHHNMNSPAKGGWRRRPMARGRRGTRWCSLHVVRSEEMTDGIVGGQGRSTPFVEDRADRRKPIANATGTPRIRNNRNGRTESSVPCRLHLGAVHDRDDVLHREQNDQRARKNERHVVPALRDTERRDLVVEHELQEPPSTATISAPKIATSRG